MKKIVLVLLGIFFIIPQNTNATLIPPYASILTRWGGLSSIGVGLQNTTPTYWTILEIMSPVKYGDAYFYGQFRMSTPLAYTKSPVAFLLPIINMESLRIGGLLGVGFYLYDTRIHSRPRFRRGYYKERIAVGTGWSIVLNLGPVIEGGIVNKNFKGVVFSRDAALLSDRLLNIGAEINMRARYNFHQYAAIVMGLDLGYLYAIHSGDSFYQNLKKEFTSYHTLYYGITVGLSF